MGFNVGMPMLGLKRGKAKGKHTGNIRSIVEEMGEERFSTSSTLDRSRSKDNLYFGDYRSGRECVEAKLQEVDDYEIEYKKTSYRGRGLREDATVAVAFIVKPDSQWINMQPDEDIDRFFEDVHECLTELKVISPETERMRVRHLDEGAPHEHYAIMAYNDEGILKGSDIVNLKTLKKLNQSLPRLMKKRGWDMNELMAYDVDAVKDMTEEEKAEYKAKHIVNKRKRHGLSTNEYIADQEAERLENIHDQIARLEPKRNKVKQELADAEAKQEVVKKETFDAGYKAHNLARDIAQVLGQTTTRRELDEVLEDAEERFKTIIKREVTLSDKEAQIANKELFAQQKLNEVTTLLSDVKDASTTASNKEQWMIDWIKSHAPKAYTACESAYAKVHTT